MLQRRVNPRECVQVQALIDDVSDTMHGRELKFAGSVNNAFHSVKCKSYSAG
jgi:hypothetical protein